MPIPLKKLNNRWDSLQCTRKKKSFVKLEVRVTTRGHKVLKRRQKPLEKNDFSIFEVYNQFTFDSLNCITLGFFVLRGKPEKNVANSFPPFSTNLSGQA